MTKKLGITQLTPVPDEGSDDLSHHTPVQKLVVMQLKLVCQPPLNDKRGGRQRVNKHYISPPRKKKKKEAETHLGIWVK